MDGGKRYYWMRLKEDFFDEDAIDYLQEQENGQAYTLFYLKLCLKSLKNEGILIRTVGDVLVPYSYEKLSDITKTPLDTVAVAMELLKKIGLIRVVEDGCLDIPQVRELIGSESASDNAQRQKRFRDRKKVEKLSKKVEEISNSVTISNAQSNDSNVTISNDSNVTESNRVTLRNSNERKSKRKSLEIESRDRKAFGEYANIYLTDKDLDKFKAEYPQLWITYLDEMSGYLAAHGKTYKDYLAALRNWARRDINKHRPSTQGDVGDVLDNLII